MKYKNGQKTEMKKNSNPKSQRVGHQLRHPYSGYCRAFTKLLKSPFVRGYQGCPCQDCIPGTSRHSIVTFLRPTPSRTSPPGTSQSCLEFPVAYLQTNVAAVFHLCYVCKDLSVTCAIPYYNENKTLYIAHKLLPDERTTRKR